MSLPFIKLEGFGNNYIFVEARNVKKTSLKKLAAAISDVKKGIGSDGLIVVDASKEPYAMRIFNKDGSEAEMCGNGLRQAAFYMKKTKFPRRKQFIFETVAGEFPASIKSSVNNRARIETSLGSPEFSAIKIGVTCDTDTAFDIPLIKYEMRNITMDCVSLGNPHAVIFVVSYDFNWTGLGRDVSSHKMFAKGANVNFVKVMNSRRFEVRTFERGSGATAACGSGAAASLAAGVMRNIFKKEAVAVMQGGNLELTWDMSVNIIKQTGPASIVCHGDYNG